MLSHRLERLAIWLSAVVGGIAFLYFGMDSGSDTPAVLLGVYLVLGAALLAVGILGFASEVVAGIRRRLPDDSPATDNVRRLAPLVPEPTDPPTPNPARRSATGERVFTEATPDHLVGLYKKYTTMEADRRFAAYVGEWMEMAGRVMDIDTSGTPTVYLKPTGVGSDGPNMYAVRLDESWLVRMAALRKNDEVRAIGKLQKATSSWIAVAESELLD